MPEYKLLYFDGRGRAEISRLIFAAAGKKYEDQRFNKDTWPAFKPKTPNGQLPCLSVDGKIYAQSIPIAVYLATEFGLHGKNALECLQVNSVMATAADLGQCVGTALFEKDQKKKDELFKKLKEEDIPKHLRIFEKLLTDAKNDYFCANKLTLADLMVFCVLEFPVKDNPKFLDDFPKVKANMNKVQSQPGIKAWLEKRPKTEF